MMRAFMEYVIFNMSGNESSTRTPFASGSMGSPEVGGSWRCSSRSALSCEEVERWWEQALGRSFSGMTNSKGNV